jgi:hypothetical protein
MEAQRERPRGEVDGDDIVVIPDGPEGPSRRRRLFLAGAALAIVVIGAGAIALIERDDSSPSPAAVQTRAPTAPVVGRALATTVPAKKRPVVAATTIASTVPTSVVTAPPNEIVAPASIPTPPPLPTTPPTAAPPKQYGTSVLTWSAPGRLTVASGRTATLAVTAHNPTDGSVTLPHPLSCTPRLDQGEMCTQVVQVIPAGGSASATYSIDAQGIAAGTYQLRIEGALTVPVTVTSSPSS